MLMFIGALLVLNPLKVFADVIPFLGTLVGVGTGIVAGLFALAAASLVTALAWIAVRPMVGAGLLVIVIGTLYFLNRLRLQRAPVPSRETEGA